MSGTAGEVDGYGIRIYSRRPVAWSRKEGGILGYNNPGALVQWYRQEQALRAVGAMTGEARTSAFARLMDEWNVRYVVVGTVNATVAPEDLPGRELYRNSLGTLIELPARAPV